MADQTKIIDREKTIVRTGIIGIVANILLASFKALVGVAIHSAAMVLDAVKKNMEEAASLKVPLDVDVNTGANWNDAH